MTIRKIKLAISYLVFVAAASIPNLRAGEAAPNPAPEVPTTPAQSSPRLKQILIADSVEAAQALNPIPDGGFIVISPPLAALDRDELTKRLAVGENRLVDERLLAAIAQVVENFVRQHDFPGASVVIPPQNIREGALRIAVQPGKIRNIQMSGNRWFSESLLREKLRIERGQTVRFGALEQALEQTNSSPFRRVKVQINPVPETGETDLIIGVEEHLPLRLSASYDNSGNESIGNSRYAASVSYANMWGLDHQASYQYARSNLPGVLNTHALDYRVPLPRQHVLVATVSYSEVKPSLFGATFNQVGKSYNADLKYVVPFKHNRWVGEISGTASFKESNNNLEFFGAPAFTATSDVISGSLGVAVVREDTKGKWIGSASVTGTPGYINSRSGFAAYNGTRVGANPRFLYGQFFFQRATVLKPDLISVARVSIQLASTNLVPSEQFGVGGASTVRGYKERILAGDGGYTLTHELQYRLPSVKLGKRLPALETVGAFFWDYGRTIVKHPLVGELKSAYLAGVGVGLRCALSNYFSASIDTGRQLEEVEIPGEPHHRTHIKLTVSY